MPVKAKPSNTHTDIAATYNKFKEYKGKKYTGVTIGRGHKWNYDPGVWKDKKVTPEKWEISFEVVKRRMGHAPEGSGAPVGSAYHWFIVADQIARKLNANDYMTTMTGFKFKLGHQRAGHHSWNVSDEKKRKNLIAILEELIVGLKSGQVDLGTDRHAKPATTALTPTKPRPAVAKNM